jgi:hypothetical protein
VEVTKTSNRFYLPKNKHLLELSSNKGLHYLTSSLTMADETSKEKFINLIESHIETFKLENKYKLDLLNKDPNILALKKLKKLMKTNHGDKVIYNRNVSPPGDIFKEQYILNNRMTKKKINYYEKHKHKTKQNNSNSSLSFNNRSKSFGNITQTVETKDKMLKTGMGTQSSFFASKAADLSFCKSYFNYLVTNDSETEEQVKEFSDLQKNYENEKRLLKGYKVSIIKVN